MLEKGPYIEVFVKPKWIYKRGFRCNNTNDTNQKKKPLREKKEERINRVSAEARSFTLFK